MAINVLNIVNSSTHWPATIVSVELMTGVPPQLSAPVAVPVVAGNVLVPNVTVMSGGQVMVGGVISLTKMV